MYLRVDFDAEGPRSVPALQLDWSRGGLLQTTESPQPVGSIGWLRELQPGPAWAPWRQSLARIAKEAANA